MAGVYCVTGCVSYSQSEHGWPHSLGCTCPSRKDPLPYSQEPNCPPSQLRDLSPEIHRARAPGCVLQCPIKSRCNPNVAVTVSATYDTATLERLWALKMLFARDPGHLRSSHVGSG